MIFSSKLRTFFYMTSHIYTSGHLSYKWYHSGTEDTDSVARGWSICDWDHVHGLELSTYDKLY